MLVAPNTKTLRALYKSKKINGYRQQCNVDVEHREASTQLKYAISDCVWWYRNDTWFIKWTTELYVLTSNGFTYSLYSST